MKSGKLDLQKSWTVFGLVSGCPILLINPLFPPKVLFTPWKNMGLQKVQVVSSINFYTLRHKNERRLSIIANSSKNHNGFGMNRARNRQMRVRASVNTIILLIYYFFDSKCLLISEKNMTMTSAVKSSQQLPTAVKSLFFVASVKRGHLAFLYA